MRFLTQKRKKQPTATSRNYYLASQEHSILFSSSFFPRDYFSESSFSTVTKQSLYQFCLTQSLLRNWKCTLKKPVLRWSFTSPESALQPLLFTARSQSQKAVTTVRGKQNYQICLSCPAVRRPPQPQQPAGTFIHGRKKKSEEQIISKDALFVQTLLLIFSVFVLLGFLP